MSINKKEPVKKADSDTSKASFKEKLTELLELPKEIVLNIPKITIMGCSNLIIENYTGIIEYESFQIKANTGVGVIKISGNRLLINEITSEDIMVSGEIGLVEFMK